MASSEMNKELRIVLLGKTGVGKSSLGNSLLQISKWFHSKKSAESVTKQCKRGMRHLDNGNLMLIIDTPGLFDTSTPNDETIVEIVKCIGITSPGPYIFILVLGLTRFTQEELETIEYLKKTFGDRVMDFVIVVFTGKDALDDDDEDEPSTIEDYVTNSTEALRNVVQLQCNGRYTAICNHVKSSTHVDDVQSVMNLITRTVQNNRWEHYTEKMFEHAELVIQQEIDARRSRRTDLDISAIREQIRKEIEENRASTGFWNKLGNGILSGLKTVATVVTLPVTVPLLLGKALYDGLTK